ncbi:MAG: sugar transferase [Planctomycetaceae bacterium]|nr:sugar transferase [Planctomycetaceae bacterium]
MSIVTQASPADRASSSCAAEDVQDDEIWEFRPTPSWKRVTDVSGACLLLVMLAPVFLATAVLIRLTSGGPVFFVQSRVGANGRKFRMWKFRTLTTETDPNEHLRYVASLTDSAGPLKKLDLHSRLIPGGGLLRATAIDELPQLFNVLRGEMSLIGPRPDVLEVAEYRPWQRRRFAVVPGLSGLWQVSGKNELTFDEMLELDVRYVDQRSVMLDFTILLKTIPVVLRMTKG